VSSKDTKIKLNIRIKQLLFSRKSLIICLVVFFITLLTINTILVSSNGFLSELKYNLYKHDSGTSNINYQEGIPWVDYGYKENEYIGVQISPTAMVREALDNLTIFYTENSTDSLNFCFTIADWFLNNKITMHGPHWENGTELDYFMWAYNFSVSYPKKYLDGPWFSALAQGHIIDFFEQLYQITSNSTYRTAAIYSLNSLLVKLEDKGLLIIEDNDKFWLPEVVEIYKPESRRYILGGFLHTIQNLFNVYNIADSLDMKNEITILTNNSINNVKDKIELYSYRDEWTYYDRLGNPTASNYHQRNTELIGWLFNQTGDPLFYYYWDKWSTTPYEEYPRNFAWYFTTYFSESMKYWWFTLLCSLGVTVIILVAYFVLRLRYLSRAETSS